MTPQFRFYVIAALAIARTVLPSSAATPHTTSSSTPAKVRPDSALELLLQGNRNFASGRPIRPDQGVARRVELANGQRPFAIVLTCADSRVSPEIYFDQGLGDIFVLRNAGNVLNDHTIGSIEYAVDHLGATLVVVVGHSKCGAVAATVAGGHAPGHLPSIVQSIKPAVDQSASLPGDKVDNAVRMNAQLVAAELSQCGPLLADAVAKGALKVVAARYDLASGKIEVLPVLKTEHTAKASGDKHEADAHGDAHKQTVAANHGHD